MYLLCIIINSFVFISSRPNQTRNIIYNKIIKNYNSITGDINKKIDKTNSNMKNKSTSCNPQVNILTDSSSIFINPLKDSLIYCNVIDTCDEKGHTYRAEWKSEEVTIPRWSSDNLYVYTLTNEHEIPQNYLKFHKFQAWMSGRYDCVLLDNKDNELGTSSVFIYTSDLL